MSDRLRRVDQLGRTLKLTFFGVALLVATLSIWALTKLEKLDQQFQKLLWNDSVAESSSLLLREMESYAADPSERGARKAMERFDRLLSAIDQATESPEVADQLSKHTKEAAEAFGHAVEQEGVAKQEYDSLRIVAADLGALIVEQIEEINLQTEASERRAFIVESEQREKVVALRALLEATIAAQAVQVRVRSFSRQDQIDLELPPPVDISTLPPVCDTQVSNQSQYICSPSTARLRQSLQAYQRSGPGKPRATAIRAVLQASGGYLRALRGTFDARSADLEASIDAVEAERITSKSLARRSALLAQMDSQIRDLLIAITVLPDAAIGELKLLDEEAAASFSELSSISLIVFSNDQADQMAVEQVDADLSRLRQSWSDMISARTAELKANADMRNAFDRMHRVTRESIGQIREQAGNWISSFTSKTILFLLSFGALICAGALWANKRIARPISYATDTLFDIAEGKTSSSVDRDQGGKSLVHLFEALEKLRVSDIARVKAEDRAASAARDLENAHSRLQTIANTAPVALFEFVTAKDGRSHFPYRSRMFDEILGIDPEDPRPVPHILSRALVQQDDIRQIREFVVRSLEGDVVSWRQRFRINHPKLGLRWLQGSSNPRRSEDGSIRWIGTISDVTEEVRYEENLDAARQAAEAANHAKSNFLANMSHEIRTPMNGIIGMSELLRETELNEDQELCARTISDSANSLLTIINDVLDFSKVEAGRMDIAAAPLDLYEVVHDVCRLLSPKAREKGIEIYVDFDAGTPAGRVGDFGRLRQVLLNLIGNAVKFTEKGFVVVSVDSKENDLVEFVVEDTGVGISQEDQRKVFRAFEQVDNELSRKHDGTGLGLAITGKLVELMGGTIELRSEIGEGACFTTRLPLPKLAEDKSVAPPVPDILERSVLFMEGRYVPREIMVRQIIALGGIPVPTSTHEEAFDRLTNPALQPVDFFLIDSQLVESDLSAFIDQIEALRLKRQPHLILHAPFDYSFARADLTASGIDDILTRPAGFRELAAVVLAKQRVGKGAEAVEERTHSPNPDRAGNSDLAPLKVMAAEDNKTNQLVLRKMLADQPVVLEIFSDGVEIVDAYKENPCDLILMDMSMPRMDGVEATKEIRRFEEDSDYPSCAIVALTANALAHHREACLEAGMDDFLGKPIRKQKLVDLILARRQALQMQQKMTGDESLSEVRRAG
jgi:PAS domain S-box-containing protein